MHMQAAIARSAGIRTEILLAQIDYSYVTNICHFGVDRKLFRCSHSWVKRIPWKSSTSWLAVGRHSAQREFRGTDRRCLLALCASRTWSLGVLPAKKRRGSSIWNRCAAVQLSGARDSNPLGIGRSAGVAGQIDGIRDKLKRIRGPRHGTLQHPSISRWNVPGFARRRGWFVCAPPGTRKCDQPLAQQKPTA